MRAAASLRMSAAAFPSLAASGGGTANYLNSEPVGLQARVRPRQLAIVDAASARALTYAELDAQVDGCAEALQDCAPGGLAGQRVVVLARTSVDQIVVALACQRLGAAFVPLNWRLTPHELTELVADAAPRLIVNDAEFGSTAKSLANALNLASAAIEGLAGRPASVSTRRVATSADTLCTLLYTSGTTGRPKGVMITAAGAFHAAMNMAMVGEIGPDSTMLCDVPLFHTVGLFAVVRTALTAGAKLIVSDRFVAATTLRRLADPRLGVTHYFGVPQIAAALRADPSYGRCDLSTLKAIFTGGAALPPSLIAEFLAEGITIVNGYGMTETGTALHMPLDPVVTRRHPGAVGFPAPTVSVRLVGAGGDDVAAGEAGEIWLQGPAVTPGYWNQPEATEQAFSAGWFRTGDIARREDDGVFRLLDRAKDMYISGGENVYPAEVEAALLTHANVADAAVVGVTHERWGEIGAAFIVRNANSGLSDADVRAHCEPRLARYKLPAHVYFVDALERTSSGKVRKDRLRAMHAAEPSSPTAQPGSAL